MKASFFGGDTTLAHFSFGPYYKHKEEESHIARKRREAELKTLKAIGWKREVFQYKVNNLEAKEAAKVACQAEADKWSKKAGFSLEVSEGFFL